MIIQNSKLKTILILGLLSYILLPYLPKAFAQARSVGLANYIEINNSKVEDGDIVVSAQKGFFLSKEEYDTGLYGVVSSKAGIEFKVKSDKRTYPVVSTGTVFLKVSSINGPIKKGDFITSSKIIGTGMRATTSGFVLGQALENAVFNKSQIAIIPIILDIHNVQSGSTLSNIFNLGRLATYEAPSRVIKYLLASIIVLTSFGVGFVIFAKAVNTGIEALGRNPLASRTIQLSIIFNLILIAVIIIAGTALGYLVIRL